MKAHLIAALALLPVVHVRAQNNPVWQLRKDPPNCQTAFTIPFTTPKGDRVLSADSRKSTAEWNSCLIIPAGLMKAGKEYTITIDYEVVDRSGPDNYFYVFVRCDRLGIGADQWRRWNDDPGTVGTTKLRVSALQTSDFYIVMGIHRQAAVRIRDMRVEQGNGWVSVPLTGASPSAGAAPPPLPTGAQDFKVDPPKNPTGPVLNLADFGAVADGNAPPAAGPDRNLAAFKAALQKCREVKASKLIVPKGVYRITSGQTIHFDSLQDFVFDGGGATFLFHLIKGGHGMVINHCHRVVMSHFNMDWDWSIDPLASVGRVTKVDSKGAFFEMRFDSAAPLDPKRWLSMNPLDEKLRVPGPGQEFGDFGPKKIDKLDDRTVRVWPNWPVPAKAGQLYLLRHYNYDKMAIILGSNTQLSLQGVNIFSFPGEGFVGGGDMDHVELLRCNITFPPGQRRPITTTADGFHIDQSQGFIRLEGCDFGYMGDDCVNIHDNVHSGVQRVDAHTLIAVNLVPWRCPFTPGDRVEIRNADYSPTGFTGKLTAVTPDYKKSTVTLVFSDPLPAHIVSDAILFNHRYGSNNVIIRNCYFHENRARGVLCNTADWLVEGNRFYHNQHSAMLLIADVGSSWSEGFGARNVIIRNNRFDSSNCIGAGDGAAVSIGADCNGSPTYYPFLSGILFDNNIFQEMTGPAVEAAAFTNLVFRGNQVINKEKAPTIEKMRGAIKVEHGNGVWINNNVWTTQRGIEAPGLYVDPGTTQLIVSGGNRLQ
ncbi:right-handed parallel beta-helix repeat-containing protein [Dinghuibacter silviterrae]|uniref:Right handed beta helix domain-containing protein n=1 Tax=Dinghuibacter silviterrae TaxID=1539049 RepID=A0A4V3GLP5_9BACT|nr:right-handed parallel beta-helix repeat-containing protein [Dinghuibacter silviterrae]TDX00333.1 hypothetical protein EDB95_1354 [Dinghuibacter silviterrae]